MKASPELMLVAKVMLGVFTALAAFSIVSLIRSFLRPLDATPEKLAATKKVLVLNGWILFSAIGVTVHGVVSGQYYLLAAAALLFSFVAPVVVQYFRLRAALGPGAQLEQRG